MLLAFDYFSAFVCVLAPVETGWLLFGSANFLVACVAYASVLVAPNLHASTAIGTQKICWDWTKELFYAWARFCVGTCQLFISPW